VAPFQGAGSVVKTVTELVSAPKRNETAEEKQQRKETETNYHALREAIEAVSLDGRNINTRKLGNFISQYEARIEGGLCFREAGTRSRATLWRVEQVEP
jgi:hypothetical protein